jgi:hypothetical protein
MRRYVLSSIVAVVAFGVSLGFGCGDSGTDGEGGENPALADVVYEGGATDEALEALLDASIVTTAATPANFTAPLNMAVVPASPAPTFTWTVATTAARAPSDRTTPPGRLFDAPRSSPEGVVERSLARWLSNVPVAYAHGTPTSGPGFLVVFSTASNDKLVRVFTTNTSYTPSADALAKLTGAGTTIHAVITSAEFDQNRIAQDGGPWKGAEITFTTK